MLLRFDRAVRGRVLPACALLIAALALTGCGSGKTPSDSVSGKVTYNGQAVSGQVVFVINQKELITGTGPDGSYTISDLPKGEAEVLVKALAAPMAAPTPKGADAPPTLAGGTAPPSKYAKPGNGLKVTITGGAQKFDIVLN